MSGQPGECRDWRVAGDEVPLAGQGKGVGWTCSGQLDGIGQMATDFSFLSLYLLLKTWVSNREETVLFLRKTSHSALRGI